MIRGRRAHGAALATLATCAHLSPDSQARLHRAGSVPCKPKTLKMSAYGTFSLLRDPQGSCQHRGRCPHPRSPRGRGAGKPPAPLPQSVGSPNPSRPSPLRGCFASLDRFPARPLRLVLLPPRRWRGVKGDEVVHFTLDALNRPNTHRRGRWIGFATCPCGLASESGVWGKAPRACFLFLKLY